MASPVSMAFSRAAWSALNSSNGHASARESSTWTYETSPVSDQHQEVPQSQPSLLLAVVIIAAALRGRAPCLPRRRRRWRCRAS